MTRRVKATDLMGFGEAKGARRFSVEERAVLEACRTSFVAFLAFWKFRNRETGEVMTLANLWEGQRKFAELMMEESWILALKAGKLGFTELECAYDAWIALFGQRNARVHVFSLNAAASQALVGYIRFGLSHLPACLRLPFRADLPGGDAADSLKLDGGADDVRSIVSYAATPHAAIDQSATHSHVDELARMPFAEATWSSIQSTVAPEGSCHIVTRGAGDANLVATLWEQSTAGTTRLHPFFADWTERAGRDRVWRDAHSGSLAHQQLLFFAPETPEDALAGDDTSEFLDSVTWDRCCDPDLPPIEAGDRTAIVLGVDAAVTGDLFAVVAVSRHPNRHEEAAIRAVKLWDPRDSGGRIDFNEIDLWLRRVCDGSCEWGHPKSQRVAGCQACASRSFRPAFNVVQIVYDPYQMEALVQRLRNDGVAWCSPCDQGTERLISDSMMHKLALSGRLAHNGDQQLREHVANCRAKLSKDDDSKLRIIKKAPNRKIDLAVAASMAIRRVLSLNL